MIKKFQLTATIKDCKQMMTAKNHVYCASLLLSGCIKIAEWAKPGQFVMIWPNFDSHEHLLGRPFSICKVSGGFIEIGFKVIGQGTKLLAEKKKGDKVEVLGPLGNGFYMGADFETAILVAGGTGVLSLIMLASEILQNKKKTTYLFLGAETETVLLYPIISDDLLHIKISTEDGSAGKPGLITETLQNELEYRAWLKKPHIFACGPWGMLKEVAKIAEIHKIPAQVSLEGRMACGVGACLGCAIKVKDETDPDGWAIKHVCKDGPVFDAKEVIWNDSD